MDIGIIDLLAKLVGKLINLNKERKQEVAAYLSSIAELIAKFPPRLRDGAPPEELHGYAVETAQLAVGFSDTTSDVLSEEDRTRFVDILRDAFSAKEILSRSQNGQRDGHLMFLAEVAAKFRAAATSLRGRANKLS